MEVKGRDQVSGLLDTITLTSEDIREAMKDQLREISSAVKSVIESVPADLAGDLVENGLTLTGGGALIRGLDRYLSDTIKLPVFIGDEPLLAVAKGTGKALEEIDAVYNTANYQ